MDGVNDDLLGLLFVGTQLRDGCIHGITLNNFRDTTVQKYSEGFPRLFADYRKNEPDGSPAGSRWRQLPNVIMANGLKTGAGSIWYGHRIALAGMDFYFDQDLTA